MKKQKTKNKIHFPSTAINVFGKKAEQLVNYENDIIKFHDELNIKTKILISKDSLRNKLNLVSTETLTDNEINVVKGIQKDFLTLNEKGFLIRKDKDFYLNCKKIVTQNNMEDQISSIKCTSPTIAKRLDFFVRENTSEPVLITRESKYAPANPFGGNNIGPLFTLANLWNHKYPNSSKTIMAGSKGVLTKYIGLRWLTQNALYNKPGINRVIIWPKLIFSDTIQSKIYEGLSDKIESDMTRCLFAKTFSNSNHSVKLDLANKKNSRNFVYMFHNLSKVLPKYQNDIKNPDLYPNYKSHMENMQYRLVLETIQKDLKKISSDLKKNESTETLQKNYNTLLDYVEPFIPYSVSKITNR